VTAAEPTPSSSPLRDTIEPILDKFNPKRLDTSRDYD